MKNDFISRRAAIDALIEWYGCEPTDIEALENIIEKIPSALPKGHGRLIDADEYSREMREQQNRVAEYRDEIARTGGNDTEQYHRADASLLVYIDARLILDKIPTIIEAEQNEEEDIT